MLWDCEADTVVECFLSSKLFIRFAYPATGSPMLDVFEVDVIKNYHLTRFSKASVDDPKGVSLGWFRSKGIRGGARYFE